MCPKIGATNYTPRPPSTVTNPWVFPLNITPNVNPLFLQASFNFSDLVFVSSPFWQRKFGECQHFWGSKGRVDNNHSNSYFPLPRKNNETCGLARVSIKTSATEVKHIHFKAILYQILTWICLRCLDKNILPNGGLMVMCRIRKNSPTQQIQDIMEQNLVPNHGTKTPDDVFWCSLWAGFKTRGF